MHPYFNVPVKQSPSGRAEITLFRSKPLNFLPTKVQVPVTSYQLYTTQNDRENLNFMMRQVPRPVWARLYTIFSQT